MAEIALNVAYTDCVRRCSACADSRTEADLEMIFPTSRLVPTNISADVLEPLHRFRDLRVFSSKIFNYPPGREGDG